MFGFMSNQVFVLFSLCIGDINGAFFIDMPRSPFPDGQDVLDRRFEKTISLRKDFGFIDLTDRAFHIEMLKQRIWPIEIFRMTSKSNRRAVTRRQLRASPDWSTLIPLIGGKLGKRLKPNYQSKTATPRQMQNYSRQSVKKKNTVIRYYNS